MLRNWLSILLITVYLDSYAFVTQGEVKGIWRKIERQVGVLVPLYIDQKDTRINAWAFPTHVIITQKMLDIMGKAEVAAILGHEMTHFLHDDAYYMNSAYKEIRADIGGDQICRRLGYTEKQCINWLYKAQRKLGNFSGDGIHPNWDKRIKFVLESRRFEECK